MDHNNADYRKVYEWIDTSLKQDYAKSVRDPLSTFPYKSFDASTLAYKDGVEAFKKSVIKDGFSANLGLRRRLELGYGSGEMRVINSIELGEPQQSAWLRGALVEAQVGFVSITEKEFKALQAGPLLSLGDIPADYLRSYEKIPFEAMGNLSFEEFQSIVGDVLKERGIAEPVAEPVAEQPVPSVTNATSEAVYTVTPKGRPTNPIHQVGLNLNAARAALDGDAPNVEAAKAALDNAMKEYNAIPTPGGKKSL